VKSNQKDAFDIWSFLQTAGVARRVMPFMKNEVIFSRGDAAKSVMYLEKGAVKLSVTSPGGKKAIVAILAPGDFFGLWCLSGFRFRMATATAIVPSDVVVIEKRKMLRLLHTKHVLSDRFISFLLTLNIQMERDLLDLHFNSAEKRLARRLLLLARYGMHHRHNTLLPEISQDMLAKMVGTTRARVNLFMNKFRRLGLIDYNGRLKVHRSLLSFVLHE
jgi:CRP-like cAMP-binding protein